MLRIDPAHPPVWRSVTRLQFGVDAVAVIDDPEPWQQRIIHELGRGIPESAIAPLAALYGAPPTAARALLALVRPALERPRPPLPILVRLATPDSVPHADTAAVATSLAAPGIRVERISGAALHSSTIPSETPVVLLSHHVVDPRAAAALLRADVPHLPIVFTGAGAVVGPLVQPGVTGCLACVEMHRIDADPAWPAIASQLLGRELPPAGPAFSAEVGLTAARLFSEPAAGRRIGHSVTLRVDSARRSWRAHPPHAGCGCRSLAGTATAAVPSAPVRATTTTTALARPA